MRGFSPYYSETRLFNVLLFTKDVAPSCVHVGDRDLRATREFYCLLSDLFNFGTSTRGRNERFSIVYARGNVITGYLCSLHLSRGGVVFYVARSVIGGSYYGHTFLHKTFLKNKVIVSPGGGCGVRFLAECGLLASSFLDFLGGLNFRFGGICHGNF